MRLSSNAKPETANPDLVADARLDSVHRVETAGGWMSGAAQILAIGWVATVLIGALALGMANAFGGISLVEGVAIALLAILPAGLLLFAGAVAREGVRAQAQARRLADAADRLMNPSPVAEAATRRLGFSIRGEIAALDRSLAETLNKLDSVNAVVARQRQAVDETAAIAHKGAGALVGGLEKERAVLAQISESLDAQAARLGQSMMQQAHAIAQAAKEAEQNLKAADQVLAGRLSAVDVATASIGERTGRLASAASATADSTHRLETALASALDTLAQATSLTEAARKSTEAATHAANSTAGAVRDTTNRAIEDSKRAAELIRAEAQNVEREAAAALERLRAAADAARLAVSDVRHSAGAPPPNPAERVPMLNPARAFAFAPGPRDRSQRLAERREAERFDSQRFETQVARGDPAGSADNERPQGPYGLRPLAQSEPSVPVEAPTAQPSARAGAGRWTWRDVLRPSAASQPRGNQSPTGRIMVAANEFEPPPRQTAGAMAREPVAPPRTNAPNGASILATGAAAAALRAPGPDPMSPPPAAPRGPVPNFLKPHQPAETPKVPDPLFDRPRNAPGRTAQMMDAVGVPLGTAFAPQALDRIAARARSGTQARRRAVRDAAPDAVQRLSHRFDVDPRAREEAARFLEAEGARISELLSRGRASMSADSTRAFLLIDAASS